MFSKHPPRASDVLADLNNEGISLLRQNKPSAALRRFTEGLSCIRQLMMDQFDGTVRPEKPIGILKGTRSPLKGVPLPQQASTVDSRSCSEESFIFYRRAFTIESYLNPSVCSTAFTAVLLYNSGLAHHTLALQEDSSDELKSALRFYKMALKVIRSSMPRTMKEDFYVVVLALLNNMGHVWCHFCEAIEAQSCRQQLDNLLEIFLPGIMSDDDADFFYFEKMYRQQGYIYCAAPAA